MKPPKKPRKSVSRVTQDQVFTEMSKYFGKGGGIENGGATRQTLSSFGFWANQLGDNLKRANSQINQFTKQGYMGIDELTKGTKHLAHETEMVHDMFGVIPKDLKKSNEELKKTVSSTKEWALILDRARRTGTGGGGGKRGSGGGSGRGGGGGGNEPPDDDDDHDFSVAQKHLRGVLGGLIASQMGPLGRIAGAAMAGGSIAGGWGAAAAGLAEAARQAYDSVDKLQQNMLPLQMSLGTASQGFMQFKATIGEVKMATGLTDEEVNKMGFSFLEAGIPIDGSVDSLNSYLAAAGKFTRVTGVSADQTAKMVRYLKEVGVAGGQAEDALDRIYKQMQYNHLSINELNASLAASEGLWRDLGASIYKTMPQLNVDVQNIQGMFKQMNMTPEQAMAASHAVNTPEVRMKMANYLATQGVGTAAEMFNLDDEHLMQKYLRAQAGQVGRFGLPGKLMSGQKMSPQEQMFASVQMQKLVEDLSAQTGLPSSILNSYIGKVEAFSNYEAGGPGRFGNINELLDAFANTPAGGKKAFHTPTDTVEDSMRAYRETLSGSRQAVGSYIEGFAQDLMSNGGKGVVSSVKQAAREVRDNINTAVGGGAPINGVPQPIGRPAKGFIPPPPPTIPMLTPAGNVIPLVTPGGGKAVHSGGVTVPPPPDMMQLPTGPMLVPPRPVIQGTPRKIPIVVPKGDVVPPPPNLEGLMTPPPAPPSAKGGHHLSELPNDKLDRLIALIDQQNRMMEDEKRDRDRRLAAQPGGKVWPGEIA